MREFTRRILKPVSIPLGALLFVAVVVFALSRVLLAVPEMGSTTIALAMSTVVLLVCGVIAAANRLVPVQRILLGVAGIGLLIAGGASAAVGIRHIEKHAQEIEIAAANLEFNTELLQFPPQQAVALVFHNNDASVPHNVTISRDEQYTDVVFVDPPFPGVATKTYEIEPLEEGAYFFRCDVHPDMKGTVSVGEGVTPPPGEPSASPTPTVGPGTTPSTIASDTPGPGVPSTRAEMIARDNEFDPTAIQLQAGAQVQIALRNEGRNPHNISIHRSAEFDDPEPVFAGDIVAGGEQTEYTFTAPEQGTYYFRCDVHPTEMRGEAIFR